MPAWSPIANLPVRCTSRLGESKGRGRSSTASITLKIAVFAPMPRARVSTATAVKPADLASIRMPYFRSFQSAPISSPNFLFVTQRSQRIDVRGPPRWDVACEKCDSAEHESHSEQRDWIRGGNSVKLAGEEA